MTALLRGIGARVRDARRRAGMSQDDLADAIRAEPATLSRYETAKRAFPIDTLERIAKALNVSVVDLVGAEPPTAQADLTPDEARLLGLYRAMGPGLRKTSLRILGELKRAGRSLRLESLRKEKARLT
jgi:transcriptional regulator with XRE-family HTH domain